METRILLIVAAAHIWLGAGAARGLLHRRDSDFDRPGEHVILANCETSSGQKSSQMAYFLGVPTSRPEELTTVRTGSFAIWEDRNNTGTYPRNGAQFTSSLVGGVDEGGFAGVGENNWEHFTCWKRTLKNLYKDGGKTCDGVYDCNHDPKPTPTATSSTATDDAAKDKPSDASKAIAQVQTSSSPTVQPDVQPQQSSPVPSESVGLYGESLPPMRSSFTKILPDGEKVSSALEVSLAILTSIRSLQTMRNHLPMTTKAPVYPPGLLLTKLLGAPEEFLPDLEKMTHRRASFSTLGQRSGV